MNDYADNIIVARGTWGTVTCAICSNGSVPSKEFLDSLKTNKNANNNHVKLLVLFNKIVSTGKLFNREQFKHVENKIYEFKQYQIRMGCFQVKNSWVLTHGFIKKQDRWPKRELDRAERIMREHLSRGK